MRNLVVCGPWRERSAVDVIHEQVVPIAGVDVPFALIRQDDLTFEPNATDNRERVLIRTLAFSLNFRDKAIILRLARESVAPMGIGSEFVAQVVACGADVDDLKPGDRVIANSAYPFSGAPGVEPGLPTNSAAQELQCLHRAKLHRIPPEMSDEVGAAFSIGAQTTCSMLRRLGLKPDEHVLVTAASSNTSLFALSALRHSSTKVYALTSSGRHRARLEAIGVGRILEVDLHKDELADDPGLAALARDIGGFSAVIDPFSDIYLPRAIGVMAPYGRHITCGVFNQYLGLIGAEFPYPSRAAATLLFTLVSRNVRLVGNCLGQRADLTHGIDEFQQGRLDVVLDSVHRGSSIAAFLDRTYNAPDRFGKVVYVYE